MEFRHMTGGEAITGVQRPVSVLLFENKSSAARFCSTLSQHGITWWSLRKQLV